MLESSLGVHVSPAYVAWYPEGCQLDLELSGTTCWAIDIVGLCPVSGEAVHPTGPLLPIMGAPWEAVHPCFWYGCALGGYPPQDILCPLWVHHGRLSTPGLLSCACSNDALWEAVHSALQLLWVCWEQLSTLWWEVLRAAIHPRTFALDPPIRQVMVVAELFFVPETCPALSCQAFHLVCPRFDYPDEGLLQSSDSSVEESVSFLLSLSQAKRTC